MRPSAWLTAPLGLVCCQASAPGPVAPPNVVLILADDVGQECFGCYGGEDYRTPNVDRLAREGVLFEHGYSTPLCTPSRVQLMTGLYSFRNYTHFGYLPPGERTFGHLFQDAGYRTAVAGKWQLNGIRNELPGHDDPERVRRAGFDEWMLWQLTRSPGAGERYWNPAIDENGRFRGPAENDGRFGPDLFTDFVCGFIERNRDVPFFVYYPMALAHDPFVAPPGLGSPPPGDPNREPADGRAEHAHFASMVEYMDALVGRITAVVDELGLAERTLILFTADNGTHPKIESRQRGRTVRGGKGGLRDNGTHVPLVARWIGQSEGGVRSSELVDFTDFFATFAELVEGEPAIDGSSFAPILTGGDRDPRPWVLCHYQAYWNKEPGQFARTARFKLYRDGRLYDVAADPEERLDLAGSASEDAAAARSLLRAVLDRCPPYPEGALRHDVAERPVHPDVERLLDEPAPEAVR